MCISRCLRSPVGSSLRFSSPLTLAKGGFGLFGLLGLTLNLLAVDVSAASRARRGDSSRLVVGSSSTAGSERWTISSLRDGSSIGGRLMHNLACFSLLLIYVAVLIGSLGGWLRVACIAAELSWLYSVTRTRV